MDNQFASQNDSSNSQEYSLLRGFLPVLIYCAMTLIGIVIYSFSGDISPAYIAAIIEGPLSLAFSMLDIGSFSYDIFQFSLLALFLAGFIIFSCFYRKKLVFNILSIFASILLGLAPILIGLFYLGNASAQSRLLKFTF